MKHKRIRTLLAVAALVLSLLLNACADNPGTVEQVDAAAEEIAEANVAAQAVSDDDGSDHEEGEDDEDESEDAEHDSEDDEDEDEAEDDGDGDGDENEVPPLATASASSRLSNQPGRAIVSARGNHFVIDSVPPLDGPNEEVNPLDMMLGALGTCGVFVAERAAQELEVPLEGAAATVEGDFNPAGVATGELDPRIQAFRVYMELPGASAEQAAALVENFTVRCPIYTTLSRSAPVEIFVDGQPGSETTEGLATATASATLSNQPGRAIVSARGNHFVVDSVPPLQGPNEERNPLDLMLGALATCGTFVYERVAQQESIALTALAATVEGDFNPAGVATGDVDPRLQAFRVHMQLAGATEADAELMEAEFQARCPIYTTLSRAAPIEITTEFDE